MADRPFEFDLFRLVIVEPEVFDFIGDPVEGDEGILGMRGVRIKARCVHIRCKKPLEMEPSRF